MPKVVTRWLPGKSATSSRTYAGPDPPLSRPFNLNGRQACCADRSSRNTLLLACSSRYRIPCLVEGCWKPKLLCCIVLGSRRLLNRQQPCQ